MAANVQELVIAFSKTAQSEIHTASNDLVRVNLVSADPAEVEPVVEDDAEEIGKGHEFAEESFLTSWNVSRKLDVYNSVQMLAICGAFGLGSGTGTEFTPIDPITNEHEIELPWMTICEGIRAGGSAPVLRNTLIGCVVNKWGMSLKNGPGRANSKLNIEMVGSGKIDRTSTPTFPSKTPVNLLPALSLGLSINGADYVSTKNFVSLDFEWDNAVRMDSGFVPSATAFQTPGDASTGAVRSRMEFGTRKAMLKWVARYVNGSTELTSLDAQSAGTCALTLSGGSGITAGLTLHQTRVKAAKIDNSDGIVTIACEASLQVPTGETAAGLLTLTAAHTLGTVGRA